MCSIACLINSESMLRHKSYRCSCLFINRSFLLRFFVARPPRKSFRGGDSRNYQTENMTFIDIVVEDAKSLSLRPLPADSVVTVVNGKEVREPLRSSIFRADGEWMPRSLSISSQINAAVNVVRRDIPFLVSKSSAIAHFEQKTKK